MNKLRDVTDFLIISISKIEIESVNVIPTLSTLQKLFEDKETIKFFFERVDIGVTGYDDDTRELWHIPEVKNFIKILDSQFPYWFYFLTKLGSGLKLISFCCNNLIKLTSTQVWIEPASQEQFYYRHFVAVNDIVERIGMSEKENEKLTEKVLAYFSTN